MSPRRFTLLAFSCTCLALSYMDRWNLSVAVPLLMQEYGWSAARMGLLQSFFFYGFTASHLPGGWLADRLGGRRVLGGGTFVWSLATGVTPVAGSFTGLAAVRIALGLGDLGGVIVTRTGSWDLNFYVIAALLTAGVGVWTGWASGEPITPPRR